MASALKTGRKLGPKKKCGRPAHKPTAFSRQLAETLVGAGFNQYGIGCALGVSDETLRKYYAAELERGGYTATANVINTVYEKAVSGNLTACIFWLKCRAGWSEKRTIDVNVANRSEHDYTKEELQAIIAEARGG